jgi:hypothetical protein
MMAERRLLIDTDAFVLLSGAGLLDRVLVLLGFDRATAYRLSALPHMIRRGKKFQQVCRPVTRDCVLEACSVVPEITDRPSDELLQKLIAFPEIDDGEALLYAMLAEQPTFMLVSGDKRAMKIVGALDNPTGIRDSVAGRVIALETVLHQLVAQDGVEPVAEAFTSFPDHKTLQVVFSPVNSSDKQRCLASIESYLRELRGTVGDDFLYES